MSKMSKGEIAVKFAELQDEAMKANRQLRERRFYPMAENRNNRLSEFGLYDYKTKRYVLESIFSPKAAKALTEIETMLSATKGR